jgi:hypothetical protein
MSARSDELLYRAYILGPDGHITKRIDLFCIDEQEAIRRARLLADHHPVELWDGARMVERFEPDAPGCPSRD